MFWGLIMEPNKRYTQIVERAFHVSMATLDVATADDEIVQVMLCYENRNYLLCNLKAGSHWQVPLDLNFKEGTKIAFTSNGRGHVHLTGYLLPEDDLDDFDEMEDEEDEEEEEDQCQDENIPQLVGKQIKRKSQASPNDNKSLKRPKIVNLSVEDLEENDSDDDDDVEDEDEDEESNVKAEDGADSEKDIDEEDSEEEEIEDARPQQKKSKQTKQESQQKNQKPQPQKQNNLINGKDAKSKQGKKEQEIQNNTQVQKKKVLSGGVQIEDLKVGNGPVAKQGKFVSVYYIGRLKNGKKFDATTHGDGFKFRLGKGEVIKGWDIGVQGMKIGGKRRITIPPAMGYGAKGSLPTIPGNSILIFEVELKNVH